MPAPVRTKESLQPSRLRQRRRKVRTYRIVALVVFVLLLVGGIIGFFYMPFIRARDVEVTGAQTVDPKRVEETIRAQLRGYIGYVLPKNNAFLYNEQNIRSSVLSEYPKIKEIKITLKNFHTINANIDERMPAALWCGELQDATSPCFYIDDSGVVYEGAPTYSGDAYVRWYGKVIGGPLGGDYLSGGFPSLLALIGELDKEGLQPHEIVVEDNGDVHAYYNGGFILLFTLGQKPEAILTALHAAENADVFQGKKLTDLSYLDLRFLGNRLYYKLK